MRRARRSARSAEKHTRKRTIFSFAFHARAHLCHGRLEHAHEWVGPQACLADEGELALRAAAGHGGRTRYVPGPAAARARARARSLALARSPGAARAALPPARWAAARERCVGCMCTRASPSHGALRGARRTAPNDEHALLTSCWMSRRARAQMRVAVGLEGAPPPPPARAAPPLCCPHPREDAHRVCRRSVGARETPHTPRPQPLLGPPRAPHPTGRPRSKGPIERRKGVQRLFDRVQTRSDWVSPPLSGCDETWETLSRRPA